MVALQSPFATKLSPRSTLFAGYGPIVKHRVQREDMRARTFTLNGEVADIEPHKQHLSAAEYIRQFAHCKSIKVGCNEGGCGACAVELLHRDPATGEEHVLPVNSCLLPVGALDGAVVVTAEGLGNTRQGLNPVQARLAAFHGTQCGFCSPGIAVSCHAALTAAAAARANAEILYSNRLQQHRIPNGAARHSQHAHNGASSGCSSSSSDSSSVNSTVSTTAADLLSSLDGNLCRCTGWRPIADMVKSFACDVDIEDLGLNALEPHQQLGPVSRQQLTPACRKQQPHNQQPHSHQQPHNHQPANRQPHKQQQQQQQGFDAALTCLQPGRFLSPTSLQQLLAAMQAASAAGLRVHLVAGNTGAGVYKQQWQQIAESVCIVIKHVLELQQLAVIGYHNNNSNGVAHTSEQPNSRNGIKSNSNDIASNAAVSHGTAHAAEHSHQQASARHGVPDISFSTSSDGTSNSSSCSNNTTDPYILAGAGVTISQLANCLKDLAAVESQAGQQQHVQNLSFLVAHVTRIAGTLVRNAATLGGHLMLVRGQGLESDLVPIMVALGAEIQVTDVHGNSVWLAAENLATADATVPINGCNSNSRTDAAALIKQLGHSSLITAVKIPLPLAAAAEAVPPGGCSRLRLAAPSVWSHKVTTHRYANEHAAINICCWLSPRIAAAADDGSKGHGSDSGSSNSSGLYDLRIAVGTYQCASSGSKNSSSSSSNDDSSSGSQSSTEGSAGVWNCSRATHVEAAVLQALHHAQQQQQQRKAAPSNGQQQQHNGVQGSSLYDVLSRLPQLVAVDVQPAGRLAEYVRSVAPALLLKGLATILPAQYIQDQPAAQSLQPPSSSPSAAAAAAAGVVLSDTCRSSGCTVTPALLADLKSAAVEALSSRSVPRGTQDLPLDVSAAPPLYWPTAKDGSHLQVTGEAEYADDAAITAGALYAAYVTSKQPHAKLLEIDWSLASSVEGVVGYVTPDDIPAGPNSDFTRSLWSVGPPEPLFAHDTVEYVGQPLGLVVATTLSAARAGAARVGVNYGPVFVQRRDSSSGASRKSVSDHEATDRAVAASAKCPADGWGAESRGGGGVGATAAVGDAGEEAKAITSLTAAVAANSWYDLSKFPSSRASKGDVSAALSSSTRVLQGQFKIGSQRHFYMEPQTAIATPEEGGRMSLISSCQGTDQVMHPVARLLKMRHNQVHVSCKRVGGGFGGKADRAVYPAGAVAVAAHKFRRQVRLVVDSTVDANMNAGRCPMTVDWTAGLDNQGQMQALSIDITLAAGAFIGTTTVEISHLPPGMDSVYNIPAFQVTVQAARCNLPPRTTVRGPGKVSAAVIIEQIVQQVAAAVGQSPERFRESLMIKIPEQHLAAAAAAEAKAQVTVLTRQVDAVCGSQSRESVANGFSKQAQLQQLCQADPGPARSGRHTSTLPQVPHPKYYPGASQTQSQKQQPEQHLAVHTTMGKAIPLHTYTLPYMWQHLQRVCAYAARRSDVDQFNKKHKLRKRGLAMVPVRFETMQGKRLATVTLYSDGSILLMHPGTEMGQGIGTKVKQTAAATLGHLLPEGQAGVLLDYIRVATSSTELLPHSGIAAASTTSEAATAAVAAACDMLLERLKPAADNLAAETSDNGASTGTHGASALWEKIVAEVAEIHPIMTSRVVMTATARAGFSDDDSTPYMTYHTFGVAAAEVEVDCCTGERQLLRADMMFDAGRSVNPAIDLGQVEGAFMMGVGHILHEEVVEDEVTGRTVSNTTWEYKPPGIHELPAELNVYMLKDSPMHMPTRKQLSAKATGEPPMLMSAAVACALQDAITAAWADHQARQQPQQQHLQQPSGAGGCDGANGVRYNGSNGGGMQGSVPHPALELPAATVNIKRALPPLIA